MEKNPMRLFRSRLFTAIVTVFLISVCRSAQSQDNAAAHNAKLESPYHRTMEAFNISGAPKIDGRLDDPVWQTVTFQTGFFQREPVEGAPGTEDTEVAVLYDEKNLYVGARLFVHDPKSIRAFNMQRDGTIGDGDYFGIILDTFNDSQNAFYFNTNPLGLQLDGMICNDGNINNVNWDGVWRCKTSRDEKGWYLEVSIPWQTLRFREGDNVVMGIQFSRRINGKNEDNVWRFVPRYAGRLGQYRISEAGEITGFNDLKMGGNTEYKPFATGGIQRDDYAEKELGDVGIDIKKSITSTLTADFTYNTDFAQVEADQEQVNLTRFSLFFPEKREFFREGAETFFFGQAGRSMTSNARNPTGNIRLFHSRRIGIEGRDRIPIIGGARVNGKVGKGLSLGMLSIQTDETGISDGETAPETNYSVLRLKQNLFSHSSAGVMLLNKQQKDGSYNRSLGFDSSFNVSRKFSFYVIGAGTYSPDLQDEPSRKRNNFAGNFGFDWQSDLMQYSVSYLDVEKQFNPEMGYMRRTDIRRTTGRFTYSPRPTKRWPAIRKFNFTTRGNYQTDHGNRVLNKDAEGSFQLQFNGTTATIGCSVKREYEFLDYDWEIRDGIVIPTGGYSSTTGKISFNSGREHSLQVSGNVNGGDFYGGNSKGTRLSVNLIIPRFRFQNSYGYSMIDVPGGRFHTNRLSTRILYTFTPDMYIKGYFQWVDDELLLEGRNRVSANILFRYTYSPLSDIYLVYNQENLVGTGQDVIENRTFLAKVTYFLRK